MTQPAESAQETALDLAALLEQHAEEIASDCADALLKLPDSHYQARPREDMLLSARRLTIASAAILRTGSYEEAERYMAAVVRTRLGQSFDVGELINSTLVWREVTVPFIWEHFSTSPPAAFAATRELDARVRYQLGRLGRIYSEAMRRDIEAHERRTALMLHAVQAVSVSLELDEVLQRAAAVLIEAVGEPHCGIYLFDSSGQVLVPRAIVGEESEVRRALFWKYPIDPRAEPILAEAIERQEPAVLYDAETDLRISREAVRAWGLKSLLAVPIKVGERVLGLAILDSFDEPRSFSQEEVELAQGVVGAVALAIENARLYEESRRLLKQEEQLAIVEERQRIARELHDSVTQGLYAVTLYSEAASLHLASGELSTLSEHLQEIQAISQQALREMRLLIFELRPPILEREGLVAALQARLDAVEGRGGVLSTLKVEGEPRLTRVVEEELYRIAQEALNNVLKHSRAQRVELELEFSPDRVCLEVSDDGVGFEPSEAGGAGTGAGRGGLGLKGMAERARQVGGYLSVESEPGKGTRVRIEVPSGQGSADEA